MKRLIRMTLAIGMIGMAAVACNEENVKPAGGGEIEDDYVEMDDIAGGDSTYYTN